MASYVVAIQIHAAGSSVVRLPLTGVRGAALALACCALPAVTIRLELPKPLRRIASLVGDASYPMYLLHPIVFKLAGQLVGAEHRVRFAAIVLVGSFALAVAVYRWIEAPIMHGESADYEARDRRHVFVAS